MNSLATVGRFALFASAVALRLAWPPWSVSDTARFTWQLLTRCVLPVIAVVFPFGMVLALQGLTIFELFGAQRMLSSLISVAVFRELSPVLASVLVAAQGGSSFAAELGAMRIREELDATAVMAVDPIRVHVVPRVAAALIATPMLHLAGSVSGVLGGYVTAVVMRGENHGIFWNNLWELTAPIDVSGGLIKTFVFGAIIGLVATYNGYTASGGAAGVGRAVNDTVVVAITSFIIVNYFLTTALFGVLG